MAEFQFQSVRTEESSFFNFGAQLTLVTAFFFLAIWQNLALGRHNVTEGLEMHFILYSVNFSFSFMYVFCKLFAYFPLVLIVWD